jgi:hypothetical protein
MEHIAALLLIVGCSGDLKTCTELPAPASIFETYEDCQGELQPALTAAQGARDKVFAQCVYVDPAMEEQDAELVWDVTTTEGLTASIEAAPSDMVATDGSQATETIAR